MTRFRLNPFMCNDSKWPADGGIAVAGELQSPSAKSCSLHSVQTGKGSVRPKEE